MSKVAKIVFKSKVGNDSENLDLDVLDIVQNLYCNGQILKDFIIEEKGYEFQATVALTDDDALRKEYWPLEIKEQTERFNINWVIGEEELLNFSIDSCQDKSSFYILNCWPNIISPIYCGDCLEEIPLIRFPELNLEERYEILRLRNLHYSFIELEDYDKEYASFQLNNLDSKLVKSSLEIREKLELKLNKPVYYYLSTEKNVTTCPKCGGKLDVIPIDITKYSSYSNIDKVCKKCNLAFLTNKKEKDGE